MSEVPAQVIRVALGILTLGAISSFALFILGYLKLEKNWDRTSKTLVFTGLTSVTIGLTLYFGLFALDFISPGQNFTIGFIFTPIGAVITLIGMLKPCKIKLDISR